MSKAFIAAAPPNPSLPHHPIHSSEALEGFTLNPTENRAENSMFVFSDHWLTRYFQQTLWQQHPLLFLLLVFYARQQNWSDQQWLQCRRQSLRSLLAEIGVPATEANFRMLMDTTGVDEFDQLLSCSLSGLEALYQFFKSDSTSLLAEATLPQTIMRLLRCASVSEVEASHPEWVTACRPGTQETDPKM